MKSSQILCALLLSASVSIPLGAQARPDTSGAPQLSSVELPPDLARVLLDHEARLLEPAGVGGGAEVAAHGQVLVDGERPEHVAVLGHVADALGRDRAGHGGQALRCSRACACGGQVSGLGAVLAASSARAGDFAALVEQARENAKVAGLNAKFDEGDAEALPYEDASFDAVVTMFGAMFAPRPELVAAELKRVCRPGGFIAMANWTPDGFIGQMFKIVGRHVPPAPGVPPSC